MRRIIECLLLSAILAMASPALTAAAAGTEETVALDFSDADVSSVVKAMAAISGKQFVIDPRVKGTINVVSGKSVTKTLAYQIMLSAIRLQGFAIVEDGGIARVLPEADAKTHAGPVGQPPPGGAQLATEVFQINHESAAQMVSVLRPLISPNNAITAYPGNNTLVITDYADNLHRLEKIIQSIDVSRGDDPELIELHHASAYDLLPTLTRLFSDQRGGDSSQNVSLAADGRTNSLIVRCDNPGRRMSIRELVTTLDLPTTTAGNIHVVFLKNAEAASVARTLHAIVTGDSSVPSAETSPAISSQSPGQPQTFPGNTQVLTQTAAKGNAFPQPGLSATSVEAHGGGIIQADVASNALIIIAPESTYNNLRNVIDLLDRRRAQVLIEAIIVELTADKSNQFGVQWQNAVGGKSGTQVLGGTNFGSGGNNIVGLMQNIATAGSTGTLGLSPGLNIGVVTGYHGGVPDITALLQAFESDDKANILSTPKIITLDNEEASITIGQNVPFLTGSYVQSGTSVTSPFQTYERKDVGLTLRVKPQITEGGLVRIQIYQEVSSLVASTANNPSGPITNTRSIASTILVDNEAILALGGLIDDNYNISEQKVPLLGDIPVVGGLFRYQSKTRSKTNLMVFLRPTIMRDEAGYQDYSSDRYREMLGAQAEYEKSRPSWHGEVPSPQLKPLQSPPPDSPPAVQGPAGK